MIRKVLIVADFREERSGVVEEFRLAEGVEVEVRQLKAEALLERFGTVKGVINAPAEELVLSDEFRPKAVEAIRGALG